MRLPRVEPQLPNAVNLWPKRHCAGTPGAPRRHPNNSSVGYGVSARKQWYRAHQKVVGYNADHFEAVEVVKSHLCENPVQGVLNLGRCGSAKEHHLYFCRHEKEVPPAAWILRSRAKPSSPQTTLHFPEQDSLSSSRNFVIRGRSSIRTVPTFRVGVTNPPASKSSKRSRYEQYK